MRAAPLYFHHGPLEDLGIGVAIDIEIHWVKRPSPRFIGEY
jgi:hypothetical protein